MRRAIPLSIRNQVLQRARRRCEYCQSPEAFSPDTFSIDHIEPLAGGGSDALENLAFSCQECNGPKQAAIRAIDPATGEWVTLFHPRRERWSDHFRWSENFLLMEGKTATGRATILRLQLNREGVLNLRRVLHVAGEEHPPEHTLPHG